MLVIMALVTWLVASLLGLNLLLIWLKGGGDRRGRSHMRPPVLFGGAAGRRSASPRARRLATLGTCVSFAALVR